jgi:hypothetical protein
VEETRTEITFATEPIISSLSGPLASARAGDVLEGVDLDEVEVNSVSILQSDQTGLIVALLRNTDSKGYLAGRSGNLIPSLAG